MALRFQNRNFKTKRNEAGQVIWSLGIYDTEYVGDVQDFDCDSPGNIIRWSADGSDRWSPILTSELTFNFRMETSGHEAFIDDLTNSAEGRFSVRLSQSLLDTQYWCGTVLPDIVSYQDRDPYIFQVRATDGIGALRKIEYRPTATTFYSGKETFIEHLMKVLNRLPYLGEHFATDQLFLRTAVDWWEATMTNDNANDPLALSYVDHSAYYKIEKGDKKTRSCYEVLEDICKAFGARIWQHDGCFWFEQISYRQGNFVTRRYDTDGDYLGFTIHTDRTTVLQGAGEISWESFIVYTYFPALLKAEVTFDTFERRNLLAGVDFTPTDNTFEVAYFINKAEEGTALRFMMTLYSTLKNVSYTGGQYTPLYIRFRGYLRIGGYWWERFGYIQGGFYQINYSPDVNGQWTADGPVIDPSTPTFDIIVMYGGAPPTGFTANQTLQFSIDLPELPENAVSLYLQLDEIEVLDYQGNPIPDQTDVTVTWAVPDAYLGTMSDGLPTEYADSEVYTVENDDSTNSEAAEVGVLIGSSTNLNTQGAIYVSGGETLGGFWGSGTDTPDVQIGYLLAEALLAGQLRPIKRINGSLYGPADVWPLVEWQSRNWLFQSGELDLEQNRISGDWYEVDYGTTFSATPIKKKKKLIVDPDGNTTFPPYNNGDTTGNGPNTGPERVMAPGGTILGTAADGLTDGEILAGVKTSISIARTTVSGEYWQGETIYLVNPVTGTFESLLVGTTSSDGDTSLDVVGTLQANYPPSAIIIKEHIPGRYPFVEATNGDLLQFNSFSNKWQPTTIGEILFGAFPSYISDEEAIANGLFTGDWYICANGHYSLKAGTLTSVAAS